MEITDKGVKIGAKGVAGHAMDPISRSKRDVEIWAVLKAAAPESDFIGKIFDGFCNKDAAKANGIYAEDEKSGRLTMNMGVAEYDGAYLTLKFDFRLPLCCNPDDTEAKLKNALPSGAVIKRVRFAENLYIPEDSPLIKTLLKVYAEETGEVNPAPHSDGRRHLRARASQRGGIRPHFPQGRKQTFTTRTKTSK